MARRNRRPAGPIKAGYRRAITTADAQRTATAHGLCAGAAQVLTALADCTNARHVIEGGLAWVHPKVEWIAERVGLTVRMVQYHLAALRDAGLLVDLDAEQADETGVDRGRCKPRALVIEMFAAITKAISPRRRSALHNSRRSPYMYEDEKGNGAARPASPTPTPPRYVPEPPKVLASAATRADCRTNWRQYAPGRGA